MRARGVTFSAEQAQILTKKVWVIVWEVSETNQKVDR